MAGSVVVEVTAVVENESDVIALENIAHKLDEIAESAPWLETAAMAERIRIALERLTHVGAR